MQDMMPLFKAALQRYRGYVMQATGSHKYAFEDTPKGEFTLVIEGPWGKYRTFYSRQRVFGTVQRNVPSNQQTVKKVCDFIRDIIADVNQVKNDPHAPK